MCRKELRLLCTSNVKNSQNVLPNQALTRLFSGTLVAFALLFAGGCQKNQHKLLERGNASFAQGKYAEALIYYRRALQKDPRLTEAHHQLGLTEMRLGSWAAAYQELSRTVELQPDNWKPKCFSLAPISHWETRKKLWRKQMKRSRRRRSVRSRTLISAASRRK